jgi:hypothetical protein
VASWRPRGRSVVPGSPLACPGGRGAGEFRTCWNIPKLHSAARPPGRVPAVRRTGRGRSSGRLSGCVAAGPAHHPALGRSGRPDPGFPGRKPGLLVPAYEQPLKALAAYISCLHQRSELFDRRNLQFYTLNAVSAVGGLLPRNSLAYFFTHSAPGDAACIIVSNYPWALVHDDARVRLCQNLTVACDRRL